MGWAGLGSSLLLTVTLTLMTSLSLDKLPPSSFSPVLYMMSRHKSRRRGLLLCSSPAVSPLSYISIECVTVKEEQEGYSLERPQ